MGQQFSLDDVTDECPIGGKQAKRQLKTKKKEQTCIIDLEDELHKFVDAQKIANEGRKEMLETKACLYRESGSSEICAPCCKRE
jgi:hypothetical protein